MTRKSQRSAVPGPQYARMAIRTGNFSRNSKVLSPGAHTGQSLTAGIPMIKSGQGCLLQPQWLSQGHCDSPDPPGFSAACRRRAATREDWIVTSIAVLRGTGSEGDGASKHAKRSPGRLSLLGMSMGTSKAQLSPAARRPSRAIISSTCSCRDTQPQGARWQLSVAWSPAESIVGWYCRQ
jgi:hypothetical protein